VPLVTLKKLEQPGRREAAGGGFYQSRYAMSVSERKSHFLTLLNQCIRLVFGTAAVVGVTIGLNAPFRAITWPWSPG